MDDLLGLGKGAEKLLSTVEKAFGAYYLPHGLRRKADAEAYQIGVISGAKLGALTQEKLELAEAEVKTNVIAAEGKAELEDRLNARLKHQALQQQMNVERVVAGAMSHAPPNPASEDVDPDWLRGFFEHAQNVSSEQMQLLWSRVLAFEVGSPGTFSVRALEALRKISRREATFFQKACGLASSRSEQGLRTSIYFGSSRDTWLRFRAEPELNIHELGLPYLERVSLTQIGLLYETTLMSGKFEKNEEEEIHFACSSLRLRAKLSQVRLQSYSLTPVGGELAQLISPEENSSYIAALTQTLKRYFHVLTAGG